MYADFQDSAITISSPEFDIAACILVRRLLKDIYRLTRLLVPEGPEVEFV
jgi:hypothetical protein